MKAFMDTHFLLDNDIAAHLYFDHASVVPIIDYHGHLSPKDIAENRQFENLTQVWLEGDHYKWRAMRSHGVAERFCTGDASDEEKFHQWAATVPYTMRNPLFHWTHLELRRYFGVDSLLNADSASSIYTQCNEMLKAPEFATQGLLRKMKVEVLCTTDDPVDTLEYHQQFHGQDTDLRMRPTFRPDRALNVGDKKAFNAYMDELGSCTDSSLEHFIDLLNALQQRVDFFHTNGCCIADYGLETMYAEPFTDGAVNRIFHKIRLNNNLTPLEQDKFRTSLLLHLGQMYHEKGWVQQFHLGALRNVNTRLMKTLGPDAGFDSMGDREIARPLASYLDQLDQSNQLSKTILYNLNPRDNALMATMIGNFNDGSFPGKIQWGSAWWFLDQKEGMETQLNTLSNMGLLAHFVGMLTDSRSFLSFPRHEYFRRILCNLIGRDVEKGLLPDDREWLGQMVENICYYNAKRYFGF